MLQVLLHSQFTFRACAYPLALCLISIPSFAENGRIILDNDVRFIGSVVDRSPTWSWKVESSTKDWAKDWDSQYSEGIRSGGYTHFNYPTMNASGDGGAFVQGKMLTPVLLPDHDIIPTVSIINKDGQRVVLDGNGTSQRVAIEASGKAQDGSKVIGELSLDIDSAYAVLYKKRTSNDFYYAASYQSRAGKSALQILMEQIPADYIYSEDGKRLSLKIDKRTPKSSIVPILSGNKGRGNIYAVFGAFSSHLSNVQTKWLVVPETWTATLTTIIETP